MAGQALQEAPGDDATEKWREGFKKAASSGRCFTSRPSAMEARDEHEERLVLFKKALMQASRYDVYRKRYTQQAPCAA